jgi:hypothetical protein
MYNTQNLPQKVSFLLHWLENRSLQAAFLLLLFLKLFLSQNIRRPKSEKGREGYQESKKESREDLFMWSNSLQEEGTKIQQVCIVMEKKQIQTSVYKCLYRFFFFFLTGYLNNNMEFLFD